MAHRRFQPGFATSLGQGAYPRDIGGALGDADYAARIQKIESVAGLDALVIGGQRQFGFIFLLASARGAGEQFLALLFGFREMTEEDLGVGALKIIGREFLFVLEEDF